MHHEFHCVAIMPHSLNLGTTKSAVYDVWDMSSGFPGYSLQRSLKLCLYIREPENLTLRPCTLKGHKFWKLTLYSSLYHSAEAKNFINFTCIVFTEGEKIEEQYLGLLLYQSIVWVTAIFGKGEVTFIYILLIHSLNIC